jgi:hypothetical protein
LPHNDLGEVDPKAYQALLKALHTGEPMDLALTPLGGQRALSYPLAGLAFDLEGPDPQALTLPPAPRIDGPEVAAEMAELYWMALLRDVPFQDFDHQEQVVEAAAELSSFSEFRGPKNQNQVTPGTLFRGTTAADRQGPYLSQLLLQDNRRQEDGWGLNCWGRLRLEQRLPGVAANGDYLRDYSSWLAAQNGIQGESLDPRWVGSTPHFICTLRDLATYVHTTTLYEVYLNTCLRLLGMQVPVNPDAPYPVVSSQQGFEPLGAAQILGLVTEVATRTLKAVWFQKWLVHRRLRPEAFGGLVHNYLQGRASYPIHAELLASAAVAKIYEANRVANAPFGWEATYLLPIACPSGSPTHPAYGSSHAAVAGACVTVLKAWFDEGFVIPDPVEPQKQGSKLQPYSGPDRSRLTLGKELDKLASNLSLGCCIAGINWRSDYTRSLQLGEAIAIGILEEQKLTYPGSVCFTFTKFDGAKITL